MAVTLAKAFNLTINLQKIQDPAVAEAFRAILNLMQEQSRRSSTAFNENTKYTVPTGTIYGVAAGAVPTDHLPCDGSAVDRITYQDLFSIIGTTFGAGDGVTTFNLPNIIGTNPSYVIHV